MISISRISAEDLSTSSQRGWIAGPKETDEQFLLRVEKLKKHYSFPPRECDIFLTDTDWIRPLEETRNRFGIAPDWIVAHYSNAKLPFYQGAATWIIEKEGIRIPLVQLRKRFIEKDSVLRSDILAHEAIHAARLQFDEPLFEEIFAYRTSRNPLRRFFGPLFQHNWESLVFILLFFLPMAAEIGRFYVTEHPVWEIFFWAPWVFTGLLLTRLLALQTLLSIAALRVRRMKLAPGKEMAFLLHLTDREILKCALCPRKKIFKRDPSLRWKQIRSTFSFEMPKGS